MSGMKQQQRWITFAFVLLLSGIAISLYLASHHYSLLFGLREGKSICNISSRFDCDAVNASSFAEFGGVPVALISALAFLVELLLLLGVRALGEEEREKPARFFFYLAAGNVLASIFMALISFVILKN